MDGPDLSRLPPADAAVALRSFERRFRAAARPLDDPRVDDWAEVPGPDGHSAREHVAAAARTITLLHHALIRIRTADDPFLDEAVVDPEARSWAVDAGDLDLELDTLGNAAAAMADAVAATPTDDWQRRARVPGPRSVDALDVVHEAVRSGVAHLRAAEVAMTDARRDDRG